MTIWTTANVYNLFRMADRPVGKSTITKAEERGDLPKAHRIKRGVQDVRVWDEEQLPLIGEKYGFLAKPTRQERICCFTSKGGVLKTTLAFNLARMIALHNIKTLIIGLDFQGSITKMTLSEDEPNSLQEALETPRIAHKGLLDFFDNGGPIEDYIVQTSLPTLSIIPETPSLSILDRRLKGEHSSEKYFKRNLIDHLDAYDVIIFDTSPSWGELISNALTVSKTVISPAGCDWGTFEVLDTNMTTIQDFFSAIELKCDQFFLVPTLKENTVLSGQISASYLTQYRDISTVNTIRRSVIGQEACAEKVSVMEYAPLSSLADDYYLVIRELWERITASSKNIAAA